MIAKAEAVKFRPIEFLWLRYKYRMEVRHAQNKLGSYAQHTPKIPMMTLKVNQDCIWEQVDGIGCGSDQLP